MSSDEWHRGGFPVCEAADYGIERIDGLRAHIDPLPRDLGEEYERRAFHIYLLGHDAVADHQIIFSRVAGTDCFDILWEGKIALAYVGGYEPKYRFRAEIKGAKLPAVVG